MEDENDPLSEFLFWKSIVKNVKNDAQLVIDKKITSFNSSSNNVSDEPFENKRKGRHFKMITIRQFLQRLKQNGSVSIILLADEFRISIPDALNELEYLNKAHGIIGILDDRGHFVYVSRRMIDEATKAGHETGRMSSPDFKMVVVNS